MADSTILDVVARHAAEHPDRIAITAPDRPSLSFGGLYEVIRRTGVQLNLLGVGRGDPVAVVMPNGPEVAVSFVALSSHATVAPLNPGYRDEEFDFYLKDLNARALVVLENDESPAVTVAQSRGIQVIALRVEDNAAAGEFELHGSTSHQCKVAEKIRPDDVALILHTSGTTARPKMVPLSHANLLTSAANISTTLALSPDDRCLNVMPLFHIHGLMAALLASLHAGASISCTPGFFASRLFDWMEDQKPTWYTAVPTMHQAILDRADEHANVIAASALRFIRSSSASLPRNVLMALEDVFDVPVIEAYGMTEASHQIASNPRPPRRRKPGSVGLAAGPAIQIMAPDGDTVLGANQTGEVVIQGPNITTGYAANPEANARAFVNGWLRSGDQGHLDSDGYLFLTGRLKEIINRGGEKISPREIDETLLDHPDVAQAVTFAVPDERLGEEVGAAVVLANNSRATEYDIRSFASTRLADFKVPTRVVILDEIPTGPTGKLQRIGLAATLGLVGSPKENAPVEYVAPDGEVEALVADIWARVLGATRVGTRHRFLDVGGDSMLATQLVANLRDTLGVNLSILDFFEAPTIAQQADIVERLLAKEVHDRVA